MQSAWFLGVLWITQWESWLEVGLIFQIIPVLLIPLQEIVNNVLEEILSWFGGECRAHTSPASSAKGSTRRMYSTWTVLRCILLLQNPCRDSKWRSMVLLAGPSRTSHQALKMTL